MLTLTKSFLKWLYVKVNIHTYIAKPPLLLRAVCYRVEIYAAETVAAPSWSLRGIKQSTYEQLKKWVFSAHKLNERVFPPLLLACESSHSRGPGVKPQKCHQICMHHCILINTLFVVSLRAARTGHDDVCAGTKRRCPHAGQLYKMSCRSHIRWVLPMQTYKGPLWIWFWCHLVWVG